MIEGMLTEHPELPEDDGSLDDTRLGHIPGQNRTRLEVNAPGTAARLRELEAEIERLREHLQAANEQKSGQND